MQNLKLFFFAGICLMLITCCSRKEDTTFDLRNNAKTNRPIKDPHSFNIYGNNAQAFPVLQLNYTSALLDAWTAMKAGKKNDGGHLSQIFSMCGDNESAILIDHELLPAYPQLNDSSYLDKFRKIKVRMQNPKELILEKFKNTPVIIFNEAHDRPQTRAFVLSLLADLKQAGAVNLAMESFNDNVPQNEVTTKSGYYTCEPVMAQLVREAIKLGYRLIPYEQTQIQALNVKKDTNENELNYREKFQAENLLSKIKTENEIQKTVVMAGYGHAAELTRGWRKPFITMAMRLKEISGIDPLTVDQTTLIEENPDSYTRRLLEKLYSINGIKAIAADSSLQKLDLNKSYDIFIIHPNTLFLHHRPDWLVDRAGTLHGFKIPDSLKPVLVQAYLKREIIGPEAFYDCVPYDMSAIAENNEVWLALDWKENYVIVFRNEYNEIIHKQDFNPH